MRLIEPVYAKTATGGRRWERSGCRRSIFCSSALAFIKCFDCCCRHDYVRHGTTTLFAALDVATGAVFAECKPRHRRQGFLSFLRHLDESVPPKLDLHLIVGEMPST